jgi:hypothetical protein
MDRFRSFAWALVCAAVFLPTTARCQNAAPLVSPAVQFLDNNGAPLAGGYLRTCTAGSSCSALHPFSAPSTPLASYTDSTAGTPNADPVVLDSAGRASVWLGASAYKLVLTDSTGAVIWTQDNVLATIPSAAAFGSAAVSGNMTVGGSLSVTGALNGGYTSSSGAIARTLAAKLGESVSAKDFGAVGDDSTDDTAAIQACITWSAANRGTCFLPPATYKITGSGLTMYSGQPSLMGLQSEGNGGATLKYYGTGTALAIGNGSTRLFAINLTNVVITAAAGVTAAYGINCQDISGGDWQGVTIGGGITTGTFTTALRFTDSGHVNMRRLILSNQSYSATTGILFDDKTTFGNDNITIDTADTSNMQTMFLMRQLDHGAFSKVYVENSDYMVRTDNTSNTTALQNISFLQSQYNTSGSGPSTHQILSVTSASGKLINIDQIHFADCRFYLSGGVVTPISLSVTSPASFSSLNVVLDHDRFVGANTAIVTANHSLARVTFGSGNYVRDNTGAVRTANATGTLTLIDNAPVNTSDQRLFWGDQTGAFYFAGSSGNTMTRPAAATAVPGAITGVAVQTPLNSDGFLRIGAGGTAAQTTYCDYSGFSTVTDMNRNIVCFVGATEELRVDSTQFKVENVPLVTSGAIQAGTTVAANSGTNAVYKCTTAGTLPVGALTTSTGNCGASTDTGLRVP